MAITDSGTILSDSLPQELKDIYSKICEKEASIRQTYDDGRWMEEKGEFVAEHGQTVYWPVYTNLTPSVEVLSETSDKTGVGFSEFQVGFSVYEYGNHVDWTVKAEAFHYTDPGLEQKVRMVLGPNLGDSRDALARNAWIAGLQSEKRMAYAGGVTARNLVNATGYLTTSLLEDVVARLSEDNQLAINRVTCIAHPRAIAGVRKDPLWVDAHKAVGDMAIINTAVGSWGQVDFVEAPRGVLPNSGAVVFTAALAASAARGQGYVMVSTAAATTIGAHIATANCIVTLEAVDGRGDFAETVHVDHVHTDTGKVEFSNKGGLKNDHAQASLITEGTDMYPCIFLLQGSRPMGRGTVIPPGIDLGPVVDVHKRIRKLAWYGLFGYGLLRAWQTYGIEVAAPAITLV